MEPVRFGRPEIGQLALGSKGGHRAPLHQVPLSAAWGRAGRCQEERLSLKCQDKSPSPTPISVKVFAPGFGEQCICVFEDLRRTDQLKQTGL